MKERLYLTREEMSRLVRTVYGRTNGVRDYCMLLLCYLHGFRTSELTGLKLEDLDLSAGRLCIRRLKNGFSTVHPIHPQAKNALALWLNVRSKMEAVHGMPWLFISRKGGRISRQRFYMLCREYGRLAGLPFEVHPHMLRHACGYELAEQGMDTRLIQDYLGHRNIRHTVHYTAGNAARFARLWQGEGLFESDKDSVMI
ncbi:tyrosine-type DNA invertase [Lelliottia nimipressuralis]|uniref:tyrosine-type DNA invertase n=1 Tax=Lelliottia nimipressuralis TaxID=69220 RepID=UPI003556AAEC